MAIAKLEDKPPYVTFEYEAVEDRNASIEQGRYVTKDVAIAIITPAGSKDRIPKPAEEWLKSLDKLVKDGNYPPTWAQHYKSLYAAWKEGEELPESGMPIKNWPVASPAEIKALLEHNVRTVEDCAVMNEETLNRLGIGGRKLKERAQEFLAALVPGASSAEVHDLKTKLEATEKRNKELDESVKNLIAQVQILTQQAQNGSIAQSVQQPHPFGFQRETPAKDDSFDAMVDSEVEAAFNKE